MWIKEGGGRRSNCDGRVENVQKRERSKMMDDEWERNLDEERRWKKGMIKM